MTILDALIERFGSYYEAVRRCAGLDGYQVAALLGAKGSYIYVLPSGVAIFPSRKSVEKLLRADF